MTDIDGRRYRFIDPTGKEIGAGPLDELMAYLPDSRARKDAEQLIRDAAVAAGRVAEIDRRADAVIGREREVAERERALREDAVRRLTDAVLKLQHRLDRFERQQIEAELAALPDPDSPAPLRYGDHGDLEPVGPSHPADREVLEATLEHEGDDADAGPGDLPNELQLPAAPLSEEEPAGLGTRGVQGDARKGRFRSPKPRKGQDFPPQPVAISLNSED
jgi:hypothetical protein